MKQPKPIGNLCLVEPVFELEEQEKKTGILLPEYKTNVMPDRGRVIAIGPKVIEVKIDDYIIFDRIRVDNIMDKVGSKKLLFVPENLVKAIL